MNHIFWDVDKITIMTDVMDATIHRHAMMQFFICTEGRLNIKVGKEHPEAKCILVNKNVKHSFNADKRLCLTTIIEPVSATGLALDVLLDNRDYYIVDDSMADVLIISDFAWYTPEAATMKKLHQEQAKGTKFYGLGINAGNWAGTHKWLDKLWNIEKL